MHVFIPSLRQQVHLTAIIRQCKGEKLAGSGRIYVDVNLGLIVGAKNLIKLAFETLGVSAEGLHPNVYGLPEQGILVGPNGWRRVRFAYEEFITEVAIPVVWENQIKPALMQALDSKPGKKGLKLLTKIGRDSRQQTDALTALREVSRSRNLDSESVRQHSVRGIADGSETIAGITVHP